MPGIRGTLTSYSSGACVSRAFPCRAPCPSPTPSFVYVMSDVRAAAAADLLALESLGWIDNLTRTLAVEISTFTPGSNTFSTLTLVPHSIPSFETANPFQRVRR
jgi:hypothetical protein